MTLTIHKAKLVVDITMFVITVGLLTYFAENKMWLRFCTAFIFCLFLFVSVRIIEWKPIKKMLEDERKQNFYYTDKIKKSKIKDFYNMQHKTEQDLRNKRTRSIIAKGKSFNLLSITGASYLDPSVKRHWDLLYEALEKGYPLNVILMDPLCDEKEIRNNINTFGSSWDSKLNFRGLIDYYNKYQNINIKIYSGNIYCALFFSESEMIYDPYHLGKTQNRIENYFISFHYINQKHDDKSFSYYEILKKHFDYLWTHSKGFESYLSSNLGNVVDGDHSGIKINSRSL